MRYLITVEVDVDADYMEPDQSANVARTVAEETASHWDSVDYIRATVSVSVQGPGGESCDL